MSLQMEITTDTVSTDDERLPEEVKELKRELSEFKSSMETEVQELKKQNKVLTQQNQLLLKKMESSMDKFRTFRDLKREFGTFFSINGHSELLDTNSLFKKMLWLFSMITLFVYCMTLVDKNYKGYQEHDVVTQIKVIENETLTFPAITLCFSDLTVSADMTETIIRPLNISDILTDCFFEDKINKCTSDDFEPFMIVNIIRGYYYQCYKFNSGKNARGHETPLLSSKKFGKDFGLYILANLSKDGSVFYYVGDNFVKPVYSELTTGLQSGRIARVTIKKTAQTNLPMPYSNCIGDINPDTSHLVKELIEQNITYRKVNCYDLCLREYAAKRNLSTVDVYDSFNFIQECSQFCPVECTSNNFEVSQSEAQVDKSYFLRITFHFYESKYTEIVQTVKTTEADLIANTGGVLGLFLELSFLSAYRFIIFLFDIIF